MAFGRNRDEIPAPDLIVTEEILKVSLGEKLISTNDKLYLGCFVDLNRQLQYIGTQLDSIVRMLAKE